MTQLLKTTPIQLIEPGEVYMIHERGSVKELGGIEGEETLFRSYCLRKESTLNKMKK